VTLVPEGKQMKRIVLAITGASGSVYGVRLLDVLLQHDVEVHLTISPAATQVFDREMGQQLNLEVLEPPQLFESLTYWPESGQNHRGKLIYHQHRDYNAGIASGSFPTDGMVICPCSMGTLASLAHGISTNLIHRAADVHLKERRKLVVVPRETPLGSIQLDNMKTLSDAGAVILPAMPGFYHQPQSLADLVDFIVGRICDQLGVDNALMSRWGSDSDDQPEN